MHPDIGKYDNIYRLNIYIYIYVNPDQRKENLSFMPVLGIGIPCQAQDKLVLASIDKYV
jgi:hypothetical protein